MRRTAGWENRTQSLGVEPHGRRCGYSARWVQPQRKDLMPNGIYPIPTWKREDWSSQRRDSGPGLLLRLRTWWQRDRLDARLARGADPKGSATLALRAAQLGSRGGRVHLGQEVEGILEGARRPLTMSHMALRRHQVKSCAGELIELARRLRSEEPINFRGAALTATLLSDRRGPLYDETASLHLQGAVQAARFALDDAAPGFALPWPAAAA